VRGGTNSTYELVKCIPVKILEGRQSFEGGHETILLDRESNKQVAVFTSNDLHTGQFRFLSNLRDKGEEKGSFTTCSPFPAKYADHDSFVGRLFLFRHEENVKRWSDDQNKVLQFMSGVIKTQSSHRITFPYFAQVDKSTDDGTPYPNEERHQVSIYILPDLEDEVTARIMSIFNFYSYNQLFHNVIGVSLYLPFNKIDTNTVNVTLNVCKYTQMGVGPEKQLLRRVIRKHANEDEVIRFKEIQYVPMITNNVELLHVKLYDEYNLERKRDLPAHVYDKNQIVCHLREAKETYK
jgi:hypothetical protein